MDSLQKLQLSSQGKSNIHIAISAEFLRQLFNIELKYNDGEVYSIVESGEIRTRKLHHLTTSDIITTIVLSATCNTVGEIRETNPHNLYIERLCRLYENPITYQEFKNSLIKLEKNHLITTEQDPYTKRYKIKMNHFLNSGTGKVERYIVTHPVVFSKEFSRLSISHVKLYFAVIWMQGNKKEFLFKRRLERQTENYSKDIILSDLKTLLHKQQSSDVRRVVYQMVYDFPLFDGESLFLANTEKPLLTKRGKKFFKVQFQLNPYYHVAVKKGEVYRFPLTPKETYKREANYIKQEIEKNKIGEIEVLYNGSLFRDLLYLLKDRSKGVIQHAISTIKEYMDQTGKLPSEIQNFTLESIKNKSLTNYIKIARDEGILDYITYGYYSPEEKEERKYEFVSKLSYYSLRVYRIMCRLIKPILYKTYSRQAFTNEAYIPYYKKELTQVKGINIVREKAIKDNIHPEDYEKVEEEAVYYLNKGNSYESICGSMLNELSKLKPVKSAPNLQYGFSLEDFMVKQYQSYVKNLI